MLGRLVQVARRMPIARSVAERGTGNVRALEGRTCVARSAWRASVVTAARFNMPHEAALTQLEIARGEGLPTRERPDALARARETLDRLGSVHLLAESDRLQRVLPLSG